MKRLCRLLCAGDCVLSFLLQAVLVMFTIVLITSLLLGIYYRYVIEKSLSWSDEMAMVSFTWVTFLAAAILVGEDSHVRVDLLLDRVPAKAQWLLRKLTWLLVITTGIFMVWTGWKFTQLTMGQTLPATRYPVWIRDSALPICGLVILFYGVRNLFVAPRNDVRPEALKIETKDGSVP